MRRKVWSILLIILGVFAMGLFLWRGYFHPAAPPFEEKMDEELLSILKEAESYPVYLRETILLEEFLADESNAALEGLILLARGEGAAGYLANLELAERSQTGAIAVEEESGGAEADYFYRKALDIYDNAGARFLLASWLEANGQPDQAQAEYFLLLPDRLAVRSLIALDAAPLEVAGALKAGSYWDAAALYIEEVLKDENLAGYERLELTGLLGESLAGLGEYKEALPLLEEAYRRGVTEITWQYARTLERTGAVAAATTLYSELGGEGAYRLGTILQEAGKKEEAAQTLALSPEPAAKWQSARLWEELGSPMKALEQYVQLARAESRYRGDAAYRAYVLMKRRGLEGKEEMLEIIRDYPFWSVKAAGAAVWGDIPGMDYEKPLFLLTIEALRESGRQETADLEFAIGAAKAGTAEMLALGDWYLEQGDYYTSARWGIASLENEKTMEGYKLAYLRPFEDLVLQSAEKYNLDPYLIWSVMREESRYRPDAVSRVGARGLMQIMPATGKDIASRKGKKITDDDLLNPEINIDFGAFYLRSMLDLFDGDTEKALAAYNGGQGNVKKWAVSPLGYASEDFPTAITFQETREYLSKVLNTYYTYKWLVDSGQWSEKQNH